MKVGLVAKTDYLERLVDRAASARSAVFAALLLLGGAAVALFLAQGALDAAAALVDPEIRPFLWAVRALVIATLAAAVIVLLGVVGAHDALVRVVREAEAVRYVALADGVEIALPEGDAR